MQTNRWMRKGDGAVMPVDEREGASVRARTAQDEDLIKAALAHVPHDACVRVACLYGQTAGCTAFDAKGMLHMLWVHPAYREEGLGRLLLCDALQRMRAQGAFAVCADMTEASTAAQRLFWTAGFAPESSENLDVRMRALPGKPRHTPLPLWPQGAPYAVENQPEPTLTPYLLAGTRGAVIVCPGGAYVMRAAHEGAPIARMLNARGISAFVLDYRVYPSVHPAPLLDAQRAIRMVRYHAAAWGIKPDKIAILGFSAGGHLTGMAGTVYDAGNPQAEDPVERVSCRPDAFIPCYGVLSMIQPFAHRGSADNLTGRKDAEEALLRSLSVEERVGADTPPAFLWHTAADEGVPVENSLAVAMAMAKYHRPFALHVFPDGAHGLGLALTHGLASAWSGLCADWLQSMDF